MLEDTFYLIIRYLHQFFNMCHIFQYVWLEVSTVCDFFFFQAEDGIRDYKVTGVQTCALPIYAVRFETSQPRQLAQALARMDHVVSLEVPSEDTLVIRTRKPDAFYKELPGIVADTKLEVRGLESPDDSLEAVFRYLVG